MKLWIKLSLVISVVITVLISIAMGVIFNLQVNFIRETQEQNAINTLESCTSSAYASCTAELSGEYSDTAFSAIVAYIFREYSSILDGENSNFVLYKDDYLYNPLGYEIEDIFDEITSDIQMFRTDETLFLAQNFSVNNATFTAFLCVDNSSTNDRISEMLLTSVIISLLILIIIILSTILILKKSLKPVETLTKTTSEIANGNYHLRTNYKSRDEIGVLSNSFDKMASSIENKIDYLNEEVQKRELFVGALTHEIKTPITSIIGFSDTILHMDLDENQKLDCIKNISISGKYANSISLKLLELTGLAHLEEVKITEIDTVELINTIDLPVKFNLNSDKINGDETLLHSLIYNLCSNALKFSNEVTADIYSDKIIVTDKGHGIEKEKIPLLTEAFYRVDKARSRKDGGMGLGLTICDKICKAHGGKLLIESEIGIGTKVTAIITTWLHFAYKLMNTFILK